ncbi:DNA-binding transcriptional LysR family regulator OS=Castellaniella defragrans OX=75697 GN=HNR28_000108 PE=3 SV=1 [Castellaniella defragrans]
MAYELTLRSLRALVAVADTGSIGRAAEQLCITQSALSQHVGRLSEVFGGAVVERRGRGIQLTERGRIIVAHARDMERCLASAISAVDDLSGLARGHIRIGVLQSVNLHLIPTVLARMTEVHPGIHTSVRELSGKGIEEGVTSGDLDLGVGVGRVGHTRTSRSRGCIPSVSCGPALVTSRQATTVSFVCPASANPRWPYLSSEFTTRQLIDSHCLELDIVLRPTIETNTISSLLELLRVGAFSTLLPYSALMGAQAKGIACTRATDPELRRTVSILRRRSPVDSAASAAFIGVLENVVTELASQHADLQVFR